MMVILIFIALFIITTICCVGLIKTKRIYVTKINKETVFKKDCFLIKGNSFLVKHWWIKKSIPFENIETIRIYTVTTYGLEHLNAIEIECSNNYFIYFDSRDSNHLAILNELSIYLLKRPLSTFNIDWDLLPYKDNQGGKEVFFQKVGK